MHIAFDKLVDEAGDVDNLSNGIRLGYGNFGIFVDVSYTIVDIIKSEINSKRR